MFPASTWIILEVFVNVCRTNLKTSRSMGTIHQYASQSALHSNPRRIDIWLSYALPYLSVAIAMAVLPLGEDLGVQIRARNILRSTSGPLGRLEMLTGRVVLDRVWTAALGFLLANLALFLLVRFSPLRQAPLMVHLAVSCAWFYGGCFWGLAM
jgi:hypothetical protein